MNGIQAAATVLSIATVICIFFAAPIVISSSPALAYALWIIGGFYGLGVMVSIFTDTNS